MDDDFLKENHFIFIEEPLNKYYRVVRREAFDFETGEEDTAIFSTVAPGNASDAEAIAVLEPDKDPFHLFQVQWGVMDTDLIKYYLRMDSGTSRLGVDDDKEIGFINATRSPAYQPNPMYQFYLINGQIPAFRCVNNGPVIIKPKIWFKGMKYDLEEIKDSQIISDIRSGRTVHRKIVFGGIKT